MANLPDALDCDMKLEKELCGEAISFDNEYEPNFWNDDAGFPTVTLKLEPTNVLVELVDRLRMGKGYKPMLPRDGMSDGDYDTDGWYDYFISLNGHNPSGIDTCITVRVVNSDSEDNEDEYSIALDEDAQREVRSILDEQLKWRFDLDCSEMLREAEKEML